MKENLLRKTKPLWVHKMDIDLSALTVHCAVSEYERLVKSTDALRNHLTGKRSLSFAEVNDLSDDALRYAEKVELPTETSDALRSASESSPFVRVPALHGALVALQFLVESVL